MGHVRVRDMPRRQQRAVFANMTDDRYLSHVESAEKAHRRSELLRKKHDLAEDTEDKIVEVWNDKKLTYRQKMAKINKIKANAKAKLQAEERSVKSPTVTGQIRKENWQRFQHEAHPTSITNVPAGHNRQAFNAVITSKKLPKESLYAHQGLLLTQREYADGYRNEADPKRLPHNAMVTEQPSGHSKGVFNAHMYNAKPRPNSYVRVDGIVVSQQVYQKALRRDVRVRQPSAYKQRRLSPYNERREQAAFNKAVSSTGKDEYLVLKTNKKGKVIATKKKKFAPEQTNGVETKGPLSGYWKIDKPENARILKGGSKGQKGKIVGVRETDEDIDDPSSGEYQYAVKLPNKQYRYYGSNHVKTECNAPNVYGKVKDKEKSYTSKSAEYSKIRAENKRTQQKGWMKNLDDQ